MPPSRNTKIALVALGVLVVCGILLIFRKTSQTIDIRARTVEIQKYASETSPSETIFVSVASFRDPECVQTLYSLFSHAASPTRIWVGLLDQSFDNDTNILQEYSELTKKNGTYDYSNQIRRYPLLPSKSKGHIVCRYLIDKFLFRNEKYHLTIDSHTLFTKNWDLALVKELNQLIGPHCLDPILTMQPPTYTVTSRGDVETYNQEPGYFMSCLDKIKKGYYLPGIKSDSLLHVPDTPLPTTLWSGAFSFTRSRTIKKVEYDPYLSYIHTGENIYMAARLYTHGCDLFVPTRSYVASMKDNTYRHNIFDKFTVQQNRERSFAYRRMSLILGLGLKKLTLKQRHERYSDVQLTQDVKLYGLGTTRSLEDYFAYSGLNWDDLDVCRTSSQATMGITHNAGHPELMAKHGILSLAFVEESER